MEAVNSRMVVDVAIIGAGPYGLSIAAHLRKTKLTFRIFGTPMQSWRQQMPKGMHLKSDGFASSLYDPDSSFTLRHYCEEKKLPYADVSLPVSLEVFTAYGLEFQKRMVPMLEETDITFVGKSDSGFELKTADGQTVHARRVVLAAGITHFGNLPSQFAGISNEYVTHSSRHHDLSRFAGKNVIVVGAGASAVDIAAVLHEEGAKVDLVARREQIKFHNKAQEPRPLIQRIRNPRSGLGLGWRSRLCTDAPLLFHIMPEDFRFEVVRKHLPAAPGWFVRDKVVGKFPLHLGSAMREAKVESGKLKLSITEKDGQEVDLFADHVICATGYEVSMARMWFMEPSLLKEIKTVHDTPVLSSNFETSVPGLYAVGLASAYSFGPLTRFAFGAKFTSKRLTRKLVAQARTSPSPNRQSSKVRLATD